jgi:hypothetical protein
MPHSYTSDPHLKSFLELCFLGLSYDRTLRPSIDCFLNHEFLKVVEPGIKAAIDDEEREYLEILQSIFSGNDYMRG